MTYDPENAAAGAGGATTPRPVTPPAPPAMPPRTPTEAETGTEKDSPAGPVQDPVPRVPAPGTTPKSAPMPGTPAPARETAPGRTPEATPAQTPRLIPQDQCDKLNLRLQQALATFIDGPRHSVEEAADVLEEAAARLTAALAERPRTLRDTWDRPDDGSGKPAADTEDLRLALRGYREVAERLLRI